MFKLHASTTKGRAIEHRSGKAYTVNGLKFAAANLVYMLLGKKQDAVARALVDEFVDKVKQACVEGGQVGQQHKVTIPPGVTLSITMEQQKDYVR